MNKITYLDKQDVAPVINEQKQVTAGNLNMIKDVVNRWIDDVAEIKRMIGAGEISLEQFHEVVNFIQVNKSDLKNLSVNNIAGLKEWMNGFEESVKLKALEQENEIKYGMTSCTLFAKDKHFHSSSNNEYTADTGAQGGTVLRVWKGWSSYLHWRSSLKFLKIGKKYRIYIRAKYRGNIDSGGVEFGWDGGKSARFNITDKITTEFEIISAGVFTAEWEVTTNPYLWFLAGNSFVENDGSNESGLYVDWIQFVEVGDVLDLPAGTATQQPLTLPKGTLTTVPSDGAFERDLAGNLYFTDGTTRKKIAFQ